MSRPHRPARVPRLRALTELAHRTAAAEATPVCIGVELGATDLAVGTWPVPVGTTDPLSTWVGALAPSRWHAVGVAAPGRPTVVAGGPDPLTRSTTLTGRFTIVADRSGQASTVVETEAGDLVHSTPTDRLTADVLARVLGRPTAPPTDGSGAWVEVAWLDAVADHAFDTTHDLTWPDLARLHPLAASSSTSTSGTPAPEAMALATLTFEQDHPWAAIRARLPDPGPWHRPPPETVACPWRDWFDDGTFSRWMMRDLPPIRRLLADVVEALPHRVAAPLVDALITVAP